MSTTAENVRDEMLAAIPEPIPGHIALDGAMLALASAIVSFDCRLTDARLVATHHVMIGEVVAIRLAAARPSLLYHGRGYGSFFALEPTMERNLRCLSS